MAKKKRKGIPVVDLDDEVEDVEEEDENDADDEADAEAEDDEINAAVAVGACRQVAHFFRPYFAPYRKIGRAHV